MLAKVSVAASIAASVAQEHLIKWRIGFVQIDLSWFYLSLLIKFYCGYVNKEPPCWNRKWSPGSVVDHHRVPRRSRDGVVVLE